MCSVTYFLYRSSTSVVHHMNVVVLLKQSSPLIMCFLIEVELCTALSVLDGRFPVRQDGKMKMRREGPGRKGEMGMEWRRWSGGHDCANSGGRRVDCKCIV